MIRAAIVGIGGWGRNLVAAVQGKSELIRFVAGATRTPEKALEFCRSHGIALAESYERVPVKSFYDGLEYLYQLVKTLSGPSAP